MILRAFVLTFFVTSLAIAQGIEPHPQETEALQHAAAGKAAMEAKQFAKAATAYGKAVDLVPDAAEYHIGFINALTAANEIDNTWLALRRAARVAPGNKIISGMLTNFWNIFDRKGLFNVGEPMQTIAETLGKPDGERNDQNRRRLVYGFYAIDGRNGKVHEMMDLRGLKSEHFLTTEYIATDLDGSGWRCNYRVNNTLATTAEYVLPHEKIQNWTELVNVQRFHGQAKQGASLRPMVDGMMASLLKTNPDRQFRILKELPKSILFEWKTNGGENGDPQHEIVRMFSGAVDIHRIAYVKKVPSLPEETRSKWIEILSAAEVKPTSSSAGQAGRKPANNDDGKTRQLAWKLGSKLSGAAIMHSRSADEAKTLATLELAAEAAAGLGVAVDPLPELTDDKQKNTIECIQYLIANTGRKLHNQLTAKYDRSHAALLETAIKSNLLTLLYVPGDSTGDSLASAIKERTPVAELPPVIAQPLLAAIGKKAERRNVVMLVLKMHTDVKLLLERSAKSADVASNAANSGVLVTLQGIWQGVSRQPADDGVDAKNSLIWIKGNKASFVARGQETIEATFTIDATAKPMRITWTFEPESEGEEAEVLTEIFKLEGDTFTTCGSDIDLPVPTKFEVPANSDLGLSVYRKKPN